MSTMRIAPVYGRDAQDVILATLIANGRTQAEIGRVMFLSLDGVRYRIKAAMKRTGAVSPEEWAARILPERRVAGVAVAAT